MEEVSVLKVRIKFSKYGAMKFIGHLDVMRYFQKVMRKADIDIAFTEGFSPHMIMSFALPLGVGLTSEGEYLDAEIRTPVTSQEALCRLNSVMVEGMEVSSFRKIEEGKAGKAMSLVAAADYRISFRDGKEPPKGWQLRFQKFIDQPTIIVLKKTKKSEKEIDIRPYIYDCRIEENSVYMLLSAGSAVNIKPELVMEAFASYIGFEMSPFALLIHRMDLYAQQDAIKENADGASITEVVSAISKDAQIDNKADHRFVSLEDLGEEIIEP